MDGLVALSAAIATFVVVSIILAVVIWVLTTVAWWRIFSKAGESGWKSLIPIYSGHILARICWKPAFYWIMLFCLVTAGVLHSLESESVMVALLAAALSFIGAVISFIQNFKLSRAFGHGVGFGVGLWLLHTLFALILGFGGSRYVGNPHRKSQGGLQ